MEIRFLGQSAVELTDGDARVLVDPFITGNPKATVAADELEPTHILLTHGHADHYGDTVEIAKRTGAPVLAIVEIAERARRAGRGDVHDPNLGGTVAFDWGWVKLVPAWHTSTTPNGTVCTPAGLLIHIGDKLVYHLGDTCAVLRPQADRPARQPRRRRARADRRPLHDGPLRRRDGVRVHRRRRRDPRPLRHVPADRDRRAGVQVRRRERDGDARSSCSRRARRTPSGDPRDRPDRGRARGDARPRRRARRRRGRRRGLVGDGRVGLRGDAAGAQRRSEIAEVVTSRLAQRARASAARTRWSPSRSSRSTTSRRCSASATERRATASRARTRRGGRASRAPSARRRRRRRPPSAGARSVGEADQPGAGEQRAGRAVVAALAADPEAPLARRRSGVACG